MTLTSAPGNKLLQDCARAHRAHHGFTLIELLVVVAMIAMVTALVSLALPDPTATRLERESVRLIALLESARVEARASGLAVRWAPVENPGNEPDAAQFRFQGLPASLVMPTRWLGEPPVVEILGANAIKLGPEPMIGAQRMVLSRGKQGLTLATDGLGPFTIEHGDGVQP